MLAMLRIIGALLLVFFIPGIMLVQALFPRKGELDSEFDWLYRLGLGIGLSIVITILVNFGLNSLGVNPDTDKGYVTTIPITISLVLLSLLFFAVAWLRGGMPILGRLHPSLIRFPPVDPRDDDIPRITDKVQRHKHQQLMAEKFALLRDIDKAERYMDSHEGGQREYYVQRKEKLMARLRDAEKEIADIENSPGKVERESKKKEENQDG